jgi:hypothetical protein
MVCVTDNQIASVIDLFYTQILAAHPPYPLATISFDEPFSSSQAQIDPNTSIPPADALLLRLGNNEEKWWEPLSFLNRCASWMLSC